MGRMIWDKKRIWGLVFQGMGIILATSGIVLGFTWNWLAFIFFFLYLPFTIIGFNLMVNKRFW